MKKWNLLLMEGTWQNASVSLDTVRNVYINGAQLASNNNNNNNNTFPLLASVGHSAEL